MRLEHDSSSSSADDEQQYSENWGSTPWYFTAEPVKRHTNHGGRDDTTGKEWSCARTE